MELDIKGMLGPRVGQVWEQTKGPLKGRRGLVVSAGHRVRLTPVPGLCQCPAKQRTTAILRRRFAGAWRLEVDCV